MGIDKQVAFVLYVQVLQDLGRIEHHSAGRAVEHGLLLREDVVLQAYPVCRQEKDGLLAEDDRLEAMDPIVISGSDITVHHFTFLAIHPIGQEQQHITFGLDHVVSDLPLIGGEVLGVDVHANGQCASNRFLLGGDEVEVGELAALLGPQFIIVVKVIFAVVEDQLACSIDYGC